MRKLWPDRGMIRSFFLLSVAWMSFACARAEVSPQKVDVCVYGATPAGIVAAVAARQEGCSVMIVEPGRWVGGILGAGIKPMQDCAAPQAVGGLTTTRVFKLGNRPDVIRQAFAAWLEEEKIAVIFEHRVQKVEKAGAAITRLVLELAPPDKHGVPAPKATQLDAAVIEAARRLLPAHPSVTAALADLSTLAAHARLAHPEVRIGFDLADLGGYAYYSGACFAVYAPGSSEALARGGRYDQVGAVFGRNRPAVGFSLDVKQLAALAPGAGTAAAIRAPWGEDNALRLAVRRLRERGETVVCVLPGHEHEAQEFACDRELVAAAGAWTVRAL